MAEEYTLVTDWGAGRHAAAWCCAVRILEAARSFGSRRQLITAAEDMGGLPGGTAASLNHGTNREEASPAAT